MKNDTNHEMDNVRVKYDIYASILKGDKFVKNGPPLETGYDTWANAQDKAITRADDKDTVVVLEVINTLQLITLAGEVNQDRQSFIVVPSSSNHFETEDGRLITILT
jgi:hypothetical protein